LHTLFALYEELRLEFASKTHGVDFVFKYKPRHWIFKSCVVTPKVGKRTLNIKVGKDFCKACNHETAVAAYIQLHQYLRHLGQFEQAAAVAEIQARSQKARMQHKQVRFDISGKEKKIVEVKVPSCVKALAKFSVGGKNGGKGNEDKPSTVELFGWIDMLFGEQAIMV
jgi:hypothetical protein